MQAVQIVTIEVSQLEELLARVVNSASHAQAKPSKYVDKKEAAKILSVSTSTIDQLSQPGGLLQRYNIPTLRGYRLLRSDVENLPTLEGTENRQTSVVTSINFEGRARKKAKTA